MKISVTHKLHKASTRPRLLIGKLAAVELFLVAIIFLNLPLNAQNAPIVKGHIFNETGQLVQGASVIVKGTSGSMDLVSLRDNILE